MTHISPCAVFNQVIFLLVFNARNYYFKYFSLKSKMYKNKRFLTQAELQKKSSKYNHIFKSFISQFSRLWMKPIAIQKVYLKKKTFVKSVLQKFVDGIILATKKFTNLLITYQKRTYLYITYIYVGECEERWKHCKHRTLEL